MAKVTIGMPLYNNEASLEKSIESVLAQTETDFELILSDDGSTDNTWNICQTYAENDSRITAYKQKDNLYYLNFRFVLDKSRSKYFCWLAGDDYLKPDYLKKCLLGLENNVAAVACVSKCIFRDQTGSTSTALGTYGIPYASAEHRIIKYVNNPSDNSRMYGVFYADVLRKSFPDRVFHAYDWALSALTLKHGTHIELDEVLMERDRTPPDNYVVSVRRDQHRAIHRLFPVLDMSWYILKNIEAPERRVLIMLARLNFYKHRAYMEKFHPKVLAAAKWCYDFVEKTLVWRANNLLEGIESADK